MNFLRAHRLPVAWMLFAFILFNGLACSIGHGLMMGAERAAPGIADKAQASSHAAGHGDMQMNMTMAMPMSPGADTKAPHDSLKAMFGDCTFAGILALALVFFVALGWLTRLRQPCAKRAGPVHCSTFRLYFPALNPRAP